MTNNMRIYKKNPFSDLCIMQITHLTLSFPVGSLHLNPMLGFQPADISRIFYFPNAMRTHSPTTLLALNLSSRCDDSSCQFARRDSYAQNSPPSRAYIIPASVRRGFSVSIVLFRGSQVARARGSSRGCFFFFAFRQLILFLPEFDQCFRKVGFFATSTGQCEPDPDSELKPQPVGPNVIRCQCSVSVVKGGPRSREGRPLVHLFGWPRCCDQRPVCACVSLKPFRRNL